MESNLTLKSSRYSIQL